MSMSVTRIIWQSDDGHAIVAGVEVGSGQACRAKGPLGHVTPGEVVELSGHWREHSTFGWQFVAHDVETTRPTSIVEIVKYLEHALHGVGPVAARRIVDAFGLDTLDVIDSEPDRLLAIPGIGKAKLAAALQRWEEERATRKVMMFLKRFDITAAMALKIYQKYGEQTMERLQENPFVLTEMHGVGFKKADAIAVAMGLALHDPRRVDAGLLYVLAQAEERGGHTYLPLEEMLKRTEEALELESYEMIAERVFHQAQVGRIIVEPSLTGERHVYSVRCYRAETRLSTRIRSLVELPPCLPVRAGDLRRPTDGTFIPTDEQWLIIQMILNSRLSVLTGGPGTGKTSALRMVCDLLTESGRCVMRLAAPTGKAAKRIHTATGHPASTIHRALEWRPQEGFTRNAKNPLDADLLVIDESSMVALDLADKAFQAVGQRTHVLLVGDVDQLPPVGAGKVFQDLITSKCCPVTRLTQVFRQAAKSMIIQAAYAVNRGRLPALSRAEAAERLGLGEDDMIQDFFWIPREDNAEILATTVGVACHRLPRSYGFDPVSDIQVVAPQRGKENRATNSSVQVGVAALNQTLQRELNPEGRPLGIRGSFRIGDKLLQTRNDYQNDIMNGEFARLADWDPAQQLVTLDVEGRMVQMGAEDMAGSFELAYATTVHKMQGSSAKAIVIPMSTQFFQMLSRNMLYTAITRAEQLCVLVGSKRAMAMACSRMTAGERHTDLASRLLDPSLSGRLV